VMSTPADFPDIPIADQEYIVGGKTWRFISNAWKRYSNIVSDGGRADTAFSVTDDGGSASGY